MKLKKITLIVIVIFIILIISGLSYQSIATKIDDYCYPAPGKMVEVGGFKLHINCSGSGEPTVILDAGMGSFSTFWTFVQQGVEKFTQVCSYDRAGLGWSEKSPNPRTSKYIAEELHRLLNIETHPPYLLVGHSFGGINMRLYANTYPEEVFGVILVDSAQEKQEDRFADLQIRFPFLRPTLLERMLESNIFVYLGIRRLYDTLNGTSYPEPINDVIMAKMLSSKHLTTDEFTPYKESLKQVGESHNSLDNKPLTVISRGKEDDDSEHMKEVGKIWNVCQNELAQHSKICKRVTAEKSGHMINLEQPEIIIDAIRDMVDEYKRQNK